ncbi:hypothetical protein DY000_02034338 [Brassica cretica]|uniref:Uncharacterized protein n=1 Tax=Brassica cretica TaxID=69181 RepID=A0ABQ7DK67_BRACR|nr:hypothetical protein DY000_02034338 [Brassica cretica]
MFVACVIHLFVGCVNNTKVSGGESRRVRTVAVSPMSRVIGALSVTARGSLSRAVVVLGSVCVQVWCCGPRAILASPNKMWGLGGVAVVESLPHGVLGGASPEEAFLAGPIALYGPSVQGVYTVTDCCVGGSNLQRSSPNDDIVGFEILFVMPVRFEGAFLSGSSRRLVALSVIDLPSGPSGLRYGLVLSLLLCCFI